jgi:hypothetical protein
VMPMLASKHSPIFRSATSETYWHNFLLMRRRSLKDAEMLTSMSDVLKYGSRTRSLVLSLELIESCVINSFCSWMLLRMVPGT